MTSPSAFTSSGFFVGCVWRTTTTFGLICQELSIKKVFTDWCFPRVRPQWELRSFVVTIILSWCDTEIQEIQVSKQTLWFTVNIGDLCLKIFKCCGALGCNIFPTTFYHDLAAIADFFQSRKIWPEVISLRTWRRATFFFGHLTINNVTLCFFNGSRRFVFL